MRLTAAAVLVLLVSARAWPKIDPLPALPDIGGIPRDLGTGIAKDGVSMEKVVVPLTFPVAGKGPWSDTFLAPRESGRRRHHGQDLMGAQMTPLVAAIDGIVSFSKGRDHNTLSIRGSDGIAVYYYHINNDTPGTNDGAGTDRYAFPPGLRQGQRVRAGQLVAYMGNSGNAEGGRGSHHLHFELHKNGAIVNPAPSLKAAMRVSTPAQGLPADEAAGEGGLDTPLMPIGRVSCGVYNLAMFEGEIWLEGTLTGLDSETGGITMRVSRVMGRDQKLVSLNPARRKTAIVEEFTVIRRADSATDHPTMVDLKLGDKVWVLGGDLGVGRNIHPRFLLFSDARSSGQAALAGG